MSHTVPYGSTDPVGARYLEMPSSSGTQYNNRNREMPSSSGTQYNNRSRNVCAICLEELQNPRYLQCLHAFCESPCLQSLLDRSENNIFNCPLCRQSYNARTFECLGSEPVENESRPLLGERQEQSASLIRVTAEQRSFHGETPMQVDSGTNECWKLVYSLYTLAVTVHFGIMSVARIILGFWIMVTSSSGVFTSKLPGYQIVKGFIDILMTLIGNFKSPQSVYTALLVIVSTVCVTYGILAAWQEREIDRIQYHFLNDFSIYYGIVDGLMILYMQLSSRK